MEPFSWLTCPDPKLTEALAYLAQHPGKELRSRLVRQSAELIAGARVEAATPVGEAIELLHTYSLIHDDLPAMDDDDLRRGQPTLHRAFDEATAILAGDGLQAAAFQRITEIDTLDPSQRLEILSVVSVAVGFQGMVGGQALDLAAEGQTLPVEALREIHHLKTGALIAASVEAGAICGNATEAARNELVRFATAIGLGFQVIDDILDVTGDSQSLGKTAGKDARASKSTYVSTLGLDGAKKEAERLLAEALKALQGFGEKADPLRELALRMVRRDT
jgi:geranylgeranyl pyrophosphate synthase